MQGVGEHVRRAIWDRVGENIRKSFSKGLESTFGELFGRRLGKTFASHFARAWGAHSEIQGRVFCKATEVPQALAGHADLKVTEV